MIATVRPIPHGHAMTSYATKDFRADIVKTNLLTEHLPPMGMWDEMVLHMNRFKQKFSRKPIKNTSIRIEVSPSRNESEGWTLDDWRRFTEEFAEELDQVTSTPDGRHRNLVPTNIGNSQYFAALHHDSKSDIPHLHLVVNRIDRDGNINDCHFIGERAVAAAQAINLRHGWKDPMEIRDEHLQRIGDDCMAVLRTLPSFSWGDYITKLQQRGYKIKLQRDKEGIVRGYSVKMNSSVYKSSELGTGRKLTPSRIGNTWRNLHPVQRPTAGYGTQTGTPPVRQIPQPTHASPIPHATPTIHPTANPATTSTSLQYEFLIDGKTRQLEIPERICKELDNSIEVSANSDVTHEDVMKVALLLFLGYVDAATTMSESCGGGGGTESGWGKKDDEDDLEWARRCAAKASWLCKPIGRSRRYGR
ncbi:MAG: relaxase/mobilization nuclease domain-containing protein [Bacteroidaceae bacterium]|nr:relaxase/mobilization nuclease domain-containing protein [Bacteroidaceae bacterium]